MKDLLIKLLALANEATDEQIVAAVTALKSRPEASELANAKNELAVVSGKVTELTGKLDAEKARADAGATALANERKGQIDTILANAIKEGKIPAADKDKWKTILESNLDAGRTVLANVKPLLKTKPRIDGETAADLDKRARAEFGNDDNADEGADGADVANSRRTHIHKLVNAEMKSLHGCGMTGNSLRNKAWANMKKQYPKLFDASDYSKHDESRDEKTHAA